MIYFFRYSRLLNLLKNQANRHLFNAPTTLNLYSLTTKRNIHYNIYPTVITKRSTFHKDYHIISRNPLTYTLRKQVSGQTGCKCLEHKNETDLCFRITAEKSFGCENLYNYYIRLLRLMQEKI